MATIFRPQARPDLKRQAVDTRSLSTMSAIQPQRTAMGQQPPQQGRRYTNLIDYMQLNREQAQKSAGQIGDRLESQAKGAVTAQDHVREGFTKTVSNGSVSFDPNVRDSATAKAMSEKSYTGPTQLSEVEGYDDAQKKTDTAVRDLNLSNRDLARQEFGQGQYGAGEQNLDAFLLGQGNERMAELRKRYGGLTAQWDRSNADAGQIAGQAKTSSDAAAAQYRDWQAPLPPSTAPTQGQINSKQRGDQTRSIADETWLQQQGGEMWDQWLKAGKPDVGSFLERHYPDRVKSYRGG